MTKEVTQADMQFEAPDEWCNVLDYISHWMFVAVYTIPPESTA